MNSKHTLPLSAAALCLLGAAAGYYVYSQQQECAISDCVGHSRLVIPKEKMYEVIEDLKV